MPKIAGKKDRDEVESVPDGIDMERVKLFYEEENKLCRETDWRLQIAYAGPTAYVSALFVAIGLAIDTLHGSAGQFSATEMQILAIAFALGNAMFVGVFVGNHFIEKRVEMYMLELQKRILRYTGEQHFGWISYQYGNTRHTTRMDTIAHAGIGIFQYGIPVVLAISTLTAVPFMGPLSPILAALYGFTIFCLSLAVLALISLTRFSLKVKSQFKLFYQSLHCDENPRRLSHAGLKR